MLFLYMFQQRGPKHRYQFRSDDRKITINVTTIEDLRRLHSSESLTKDWYRTAPAISRDIGQFNIMTDLPAAGGLRSVEQSLLYHHKFGQVPVSGQQPTRNIRDAYESDNVGSHLSDGFGSFNNSPRVQNGNRLICHNSLQTKTFNLFI